MTSTQTTITDRATLTPEEAEQYVEATGNYYGHGEDTHERAFDAKLQEIIDELEPAQHTIGLNPDMGAYAHRDAIVRHRVAAGRLLRHHGVDLRPEVRPYVYEHEALLDEADWGAVNRYHLARELRRAVAGEESPEVSDFWIGLADMAIEQAEKEGML